MNLLEVKDLFSEIVDNCPELEGVHFMIVPSIAVHSIVEGYEIHMSGKKLDDTTLVFLRDLSNKYGLYYENKDGAVGIFKINKAILK